MQQTASSKDGHALLPADEYAVMVLMVDDQPMVGEAVRRMLADKPDIDFHYCADPANALAMAKRIKPTVILQDLVLPGADGLEMVREYRAHAATTNIPLIVLSTREEPLVKSDAFLAGANDYLVKLPDPVELVARIRYHSRAYINQLQRDEAYRALRKSQHQLLETNLELQRLTNTDALTGLSNRRNLEDRLELEWNRAIREQSEIAALMIDADEFKRYNDTYGHPAGDEVLMKVANIMRVCCRRTTDVAARYGGEEFVILLPNSSREGARSIGEQLRQGVADLHIPHRASAVNDCVTVTVGVAVMVPQRGSSPRSLVEVADVALYRAKQEGRNRVLMAD
ncbi:MAG: PleD family two-component system response regulator [Moraxellaceae bacterium]|jgi:two-component system chemotaxis family response regulator WspR|nr:PleD family two-component system response regulator [Moraxellaceae bacterium]